MKVGIIGLPSVGKSTLFQLLTGAAAPAPGGRPEARFGVACVPDPKERAQCQALLAALQDTQKVMQDQHARLALAGLLALVRSQQKLNERKSVIYFTAASTSWMILKK